MAARICIPTPRDGLSLRQLSGKDARELFELVDRNRAHLSSWWDDDCPMYENVDELASDLFEDQLSRSLRFGIWIDSILIGYLSMSPSNWYEGYGCLGYWITSEECKKGYATVVVGSFTRHAFEFLDLDTLVAYVNQGNEASQKVLERSGYILIESSKDSMKFKAVRN